MSTRIRPSSSGARTNIASALRNHVLSGTLCAVASQERARPRQPRSCSNISRLLPRGHTDLAMMDLLCTNASSQPIPSSRPLETQKPYEITTPADSWEPFVYR
jgi:hypothetical protein